MELVNYLKIGAILLLVLLTKAAYLIVFRLYFHPCRHIPGPLLARLSYVYQFYYDIVLGGCMSENILRLHEIYGKLKRSFFGNAAWTNYPLQVQLFALHLIEFMSTTPSSTSSQFLALTRHSTFDRQLIDSEYMDRKRCF